MGNAQKPTNHWTFIQIFDVTKIINEFYKINNKYELIREHIHNKTAYKTEFFNSYAIIDNLKNKIVNRKDQILPTKTRKTRALINALGSIIKTITGNLNQEDAEKFDKNLNIIRQNENNLKVALDKQMTLLSKSINNFQQTIKNVLIISLF